MIILSVSRKRTLTLRSASAPDEEEWIGERDEHGDGSGDAVCPQVREHRDGDGRGCAGSLGAAVELEQGPDHRRPPARGRRPRRRILRGDLRQQGLRAREERDGGSAPHRAQQRGREGLAREEHHPGLPGRPRGRREARLRVGLPGGPTHHRAAARGDGLASVLIQGREARTPLAYCPLDCNAQPRG